MLYLTYYILLIFMFPIRLLHFVRQNQISGKVGLKKT
jgi:hypothetical protein